MTSYRPIVRAYQKHGLTHVLLRGLEYLLLQTTPTRKLYWATAPTLYQKWHSRTLQEYTNSLQAFDYRYIDPNYIELLTPRGRPGEGVLNDIGAVIEGPWDQQRCKSDAHSLLFAERLSETLIYQAINNRYKNETEWKETEFYEKVADIVGEGNKVWHGCETLKDIKERTRYIDSLYNKIKDQGYKTQMELREGKPSIDEPFGYANAFLMEVAVDIGRNGELFLVDGRHRLGIAQVLDLDSIPVTIIARHEEWVKKVRQSAHDEKTLIQKYNTR